MNTLALVCFVCAIVNTVLASAVIARDPGLRLNRLMGMIPVCVAHWALMEALWTVQTDAQSTIWMIRASSLGWMGLGPVSFHVFVELAAERAGSLRRMLPWAYGLAGLSMLLYIATPWCLTEVFPMSWGWGYRVGPLFPLVYLAVSVPVSVVLLNWRRVDRPELSLGERRVARSVFLGVGLALGAASFTDVVMPMLGRPVPQLSVPIVTAVMLAVAYHLQRFGFSAFSPEAFAEEMLESLGDGVVMLRPDGRIRHANPAFVRLAGESVESLRVRRFHSLVPDWPGPDADSSAATEIETELSTADARSIPVSISSCRLQSDPGAILGSAVLVRDLRDVAGLRDRLMTSGRLAAVGELSGGIAHEIREPLAAVRDDLEGLRDRWSALASELRQAAEGDGPAEVLCGEGEELIDECLEGVDRVGGIIADVGGLAARDARERRDVDVNGAIERALRMVMPPDAGAIEVELDLQDLPPVRGFAPQLEQVFGNLLENAIHAVEGAGRIQVTTRAGDAGVCIEIEDDGPGIDDAVRDRIFDPFFTTKPVGEGTGLGLAISYQIVRNHDGLIRADSADGHGAVFRVELPGEPDRAADCAEVG